MSTTTLYVSSTGSNMISADVINSACTDGVYHVFADVVDDSALSAYDIATKASLLFVDAMREHADVSETDLNLGTAPFECDAKISLIRDAFMQYAGVKVYFHREDEPPVYGASPIEMQQVWDAGVAGLINFIFSTNSYVEISG